MHATVPAVGRTHIVNHYNMSPNAYVIRGITEIRKFFAKNFCCQRKLYRQAAKETKNVLIIMNAATGCALILALNMSPAHLGPNVKSSIIKHYAFVPMVLLEPQIRNAQFVSTFVMSARTVFGMEIDSHENK